MWCIKVKGETIYVDHLNSHIGFSTKETPDNNHTKGSIKFKNINLKIEEINNQTIATIRASSELDHHADNYVDTEILGSTPREPIKTTGLTQIEHVTRIQSNEDSQSKNPINTKLYIITNSSLSIGYQAAQGCHALHEFEQLYRDSYYRDWLLNPTIVLLTCNKDMIELERLFRDHNEPFATWTEPDLDDQLTAIAIVPFKKETKRYLSQFKLLGN